MSRRGGRNNLQSWKEKFALLMKIQKPGDSWTLEASENCSPAPCGWYQNVQSHLFASFDCSSCFRGWKSAQSSILFHLRLERSWPQNQGQVKMWMFRQKCRRCTMAAYEEPNFDEEARDTVLHNLVSTILEKSYGEPQRPRRPCAVEGIQEGPHDKLNCEACKHGMCTEIRTSRPMAIHSSLAPSESEECLKIVFFFLAMILIAFFALLLQNN
ncbi:receptor-transporting protein 3-like isoform X2 [Paroedura picta]|uniref:receptor-transporting protein 3-like isoform X2 n=1 Tax=Paroedura picta TaxID=143630 RepID=UPI0040572626